MSQLMLFACGPYTSGQIFHKQLRAFHLGWFLGQNGLTEPTVPQNLRRRPRHIQDATHERSLTGCIWVGAIPVFEALGMGP